MKYLLIVLLVVSVALNVLLFYAWQTAAKSASNTRKELDTVNVELKQLQSNFDALTGQKG